MSAPESSSGQPRYYDPTEVEAYIAEASTTIRNLQLRLEEAIRRADDAEQGIGGSRPETASLGRALLLASEVADKTMSDADAQAAEIVRGAQDTATEILEAARAEAGQVVDAARAAAANVFRDGEARLLAAVNAFVEGSNLLRAELAKTEDDARNWRSHPVSQSFEQATAPRPPSTSPSMSPPYRPISADLDGTGRPDASPFAQVPGGIHNRAYRVEPAQSGVAHDAPSSHASQPVVQDGGLPFTNGQRPSGQP